jgi:hypothetical protein
VSKSNKPRSRAARRNAARDARAAANAQPPLISPHRPMGPIEILLGVLFPIFITVGLVATSASTTVEFWVARAGFTFAAIDALGLTAWWLYKGDFAIWKYAVGVPIFIFVAIALPTIWKWIDRKEEIAIEPPDLTLTFVYPKEPTLIVVNDTDKNAQNIVYLPQIYNLDIKDRRDELHPRSETRN